VKKKMIVALLIFVMLVSILVAVYWLSKSGKLMLLAEKHWETYGLGGTCIPGSHNLFVADVDGDGVMEIVTGGLMYWVVNGSRRGFEAPLKVWVWDGQNITLKGDHKWPGVVSCVYVADADGDGVNEILTGGAVMNETGIYGAVMNETGIYGSIRFWRWDDRGLSLKAAYEGFLLA
jgi:hypothetical protein